MNGPDASKYAQAIDIVKRAQAGNVEPEYQIAKILGPRYPTGIPTIRAIWAAQEVLVDDPDRAQALLSEHTQLP